jgi:probable rRNA maturation factor
VNTVDVANGTRVELDEAAVAALVARALEAEGVVQAELSVEFVGERRIRALNRDHRGKDEVTDVLSFPLEEPGEWEAAGEVRSSVMDDHPDAGDAPDGDDVPDEGPPPRLLGDVVICARQALRQARADSLPASFELAVLLVHGTLHLLGYDHETDAGEMALRQAEVLELVRWEDLVVTTPR